MASGSPRFSPSDLPLLLFCAWSGGREASRRQLSISHQGVRREPPRSTLWTVGAPGAAAPPLGAVPGSPGPPLAPADALLDDVIDRLLDARQSRPGKQVQLTEQVTKAGGRGPCKGGCWPPLCCWPGPAAGNGARAALRQGPPPGAGLLRWGRGGGAGVGRQRSAAGPVLQRRPGGAPPKASGGAPLCALAGDPAAMPHGQGDLHEPAKPAGAGGADQNLRCVARCARAAPGRRAGGRAPRSGGGGCAAAESSARRLAAV